MGGRNKVLGGEGEWEGLKVWEVGAFQILCVEREQGHSLGKPSGLRDSLRMCRR